MESRFEGRTVLVTGSTSGIGRAIAAAFAKEGARMLLHGRDEGRLAEVVAEATNAGAASVEPLRFDLADCRAIAGDLGAFALPESLDVLVHSAGVVTLGSVVDTTPEQLRHNLSVNLEGPFVLTGLVVPRLVRARGQVVFINSGAGLNARAGWAAYAASKHGLKALADSLRQELSTFGVRVLSVYPGRTATPMQAEVREFENAPYEAADYIQTEDVANMVLEAVALPRSADVIDLNIRTGPR